MQITKITKNLRHVALAAACLLPFTSAMAADSYDPATGLVTVESIIVGTTEYRNVVVQPGSVVSYSTAAPSSTLDTVDLTKGLLTLRSIAVGTTVFSDVVITVANVISIGSSAPAPATVPVTITVTG